jgi:hypothetical protein
MNIYLCKCIIHTLYFLHVLATHVDTFREVQYEGYVLRNITEFFETMKRYIILTF